MSSPTYEPLPTDESRTQPTTTKHPSRIHRLIHSRALIISLGFIFVALVSFKAGQWSTQHQATFPGSSASQSDEITPVTFPSDEDKSPASQDNSTVTDMTGGKYSVGYFVNWGIYGRKFPPSLIPANDLTHLLYAFADISPDSGEVKLSDVWADKDIHYPGDSWNDPGHERNLYGNFKAIYNLKKQHRHLKVLLSIGGWTYSPKFHPVVVSPSLRARFVESSIALLEDYGLDGLDVDYEYPSDDSQAKGYVDLLHELRRALDEHAAKKGANYRFLLTIAAPCGIDNYRKLHVAPMNEVLDFWNLMAYDFAGSWGSVADHQANVYGGDVNGAQAIDWYISQGVPPHKIVMGIPLYGRSFANTDGPGHPFSGVGQGSWEQGVYDYRALPLPGSQIHHDTAKIASWSVDRSSREFISFDDEAVGLWKGGWIAKRGLRGAMFWELSGDKGSDRPEMERGRGKDPVPGQSLVRIVKENMGPLDTSENWLHYEGSRFENLRSGMQ